MKNVYKACIAILFVFAVLLLTAQFAKTCATCAGSGDWANSTAGKANITADRRGYSRHASKYNVSSWILRQRPD